MHEQLGLWKRFVRWFDSIWPEVDMKPEGLYAACSYWIGGKHRWDGKTQTGTLACLCGAVARSSYPPVPAPEPHSYDIASAYPHYEPPSMSKYKTVEDLICSLVTHVRDPRALLMAVHKRTRISCFYCADCDIDFGIDYRALFTHVETREHMEKEVEGVERIMRAGGCVTCGAFDKRDCRCSISDSDRAIGNLRSLDRGVDEE